eukprot:s4162_g6.t1
MYPCLLLKVRAEYDLQLRALHLNVVAELPGNGKLHTGGGEDEERSPGARSEDNAVASHSAVTSEHGEGDDDYLQQGDEDAIDDWCDITELDNDKRGPALRNRLEGEAAIHKRLLDRERLKDPNNGVKYFKSFLRPLFVNGAAKVFLYRFQQFMNLHRGNGDMLLQEEERQVEPCR